MNAEERDVVSSVGSAIVAALVLLVFCIAAGMASEVAVQAAVFMGAAVSAAHLVRHGLLLTIQHKFGPVGEDAEKHWLRVQVSTEAEAKAFWRAMYNRETDEKGYWQDKALQAKEVK